MMQIWSKNWTKTKIKKIECLIFFLKIALNNLPLPPVDMSIITGLDLTYLTNPSWSLWEQRDAIKREKQVYLFFSFLAQSFPVLQTRLGPSRLLGASRSAACVTDLQAGDVIRTPLVTPLPCGSLFPGRGSNPACGAGWKESLRGLGGSHCAPFSGFPVRLRFYRSCSSHEKKKPIRTQDVKRCRRDVFLLNF